MYWKVDPFLASSVSPDKALDRGLAENEREARRRINFSGVKDRDVTVGRSRGCMPFILPH